mmetsp:Transcript_29298/g.68343  ORF Transcript_29298/g.68343 Transcript_29298/m.68343 type:complete len:100 (+) Transcript_29298:216-515(+)
MKKLGDIQRTSVSRSLGKLPRPRDEGLEFLYRLVTEWRALVFAKENIQRRQPSGNGIATLDPTPRVPYVPPLSRLPTTTTMFSLAPPPPPPSVTEGDAF